MKNGNSFPKYRLGDISESIEYGLTASASKEQIGPRFLRITDIQNDGVQWDAVPYCDCPSVDRDRYGLRKGDIVFARTGATTGKSFLIRACPDSVVFASYLIRVRPSARVHPDFLAQFFRTPDYWNQISVVANGSTQPGVNGSKLKELSVPLPPLPEQRRIAAILDKADAIRRKREEGIRLTEELLRSTFLQMFGDPATNTKKWPTGKLGDLSSIRRGSSPRPIEKYMGGNVPWIKIGDATKGDSFYITKTEDHVTQAEATKSVLLEPGSLVTANSGVSLGFARILKIKGCVHDGWLSVENLDERLNKVYLLKLINCLTDHFRAIAPEGTQPNLNTGIMKKYPVPMPPIDLQRRFEKAAFATVELAATRKKAAVETESFFASLVQRAFRGSCNAH